MCLKEKPSHSCHRHLNFALFSGRILAGTKKITGLKESTPWNEVRSICMILNPHRGFMLPKPFSREVIYELCGLEPDMHCRTFVVCQILMVSSHLETVMYDRNKKKARSVHFLNDICLPPPLFLRPFSSLTYASQISGK
jgi:hypothetical protein